MTRKTISLVLLFYFLIAVAFATVMHALQPFPAWDTAAISGLVGEAISIFVMAGVIPLIIWAFGRFRAANAAPAMIAWGILGVILAALNGIGTLYDRNLAVDEAAKSFVLAGKDRDDFLRQSKRGCVDTQNRSALNRQIGFTAQQIDTFCACSADALSRAITVEEFRYLALNGRLSASLQSKADQISQSCMLALRR